MTRSDRRLNVDHYRHNAALLRGLARQTRFDDVRRQLLDLAESFDLIAAGAERWQALEPADLVS